jgi:hypothetical protein
MSYTSYKQKYPQLLCPRSKGRRKYQRYSICMERSIWICDQNLEKLDKEFWKHYNEEKKRENKKEN